MYRMEVSVSIFNGAVFLLSFSFWQVLSKWLVRAPELVFLREPLIPVSVRSTYQNKISIKVATGNFKVLIVTQKVIKHRRGLSRSIYRKHLNMQARVTSPSSSIL
ncbi:hypothetical protein F4860DRAFT_391556 [Xylaria cubensis]|nr:hypothetical protein F4860DRAFT_391556 [Xylaria cubensis]